MPNRPPRFCRYAGCGHMTTDPSGYCVDHRKLYEDRQRDADRRRGSARERGYGVRWRKYSKWFLSLPQNQFCMLRLDDKCAIVAQCVDHIDPPDSANDPRFWDTTNHQPACIHCNSVKGHRKLVGTYTFGSGKDVK